MWVLEGGGAIVRRRGRAKLAPRGFSPLSDFSHGGIDSGGGRRQREGGQNCEGALHRSQRIIEADTEYLSHHAHHVSFHLDGVRPDALYHNTH